jgi:peptidoglycan/xylan/chitin deacetylase (PgdA/CDA1 family)
MRLRDLSIIQYQNISQQDHIYKLWLPAGAFKKQMAYFASGEFQVLSMDEALQYLQKALKIKDARPISLTFDNGFLDFYEEAFPLLAEHHFPATLLVSPKRVGTTRTIGNHPVSYLTWEILGELARQNITIGAYEDGHWNINKIPEDDVRRHIIEYKKRLEDKLGVEILHYGVKEGVPDRNIRDLLMSQGYRAFLTQCPTFRRPDLFSLGRIQVDDDDFNIFLTKVSRTYLFFKDKKSWRYIRTYKLDRVAHRLSETLDRIRGVKPH